MSFKLSTNGRIFTAFWLFGLVNNVLYVVLLSAAIDLVGTTLPKSMVLLPDVVPSFFIKLVAPFFIHVVPYKVRITLLVALSFCGMVTVALSDHILFKLFGIAVASLSSGLGEISFLSLTHFYGDVSISGFSSGTGGAGLVGSFVYLALTTWLGIPVKTTLLIFSIAPTTFWLAFYSILPPASEVAGLSALHGYDKDDNSDESQEELLSEPNDEHLEYGLPSQNSTIQVRKPKLGSIFATIQRLKPLVVPYMMPLFLVYVAEYIINQGISPTLLFPIEEMPFQKYRDAYVTYGTLYQCEYFIFIFFRPFTF